MTLSLSSVLCLLFLATAASAFTSTIFTAPTPLATTTADKHVGFPLYLASKVPPPKRKGYVPKWKKKKTLAELSGDTPVDLTQVGLKGTIKVVFRQGNDTKSTMAAEGQLLRDVASQAGQFIKYGCGKGECGTCESLCNGQWIRPCSTNVPALPEGEEYVIQVKQTNAKVVSSGKFYSVRSIFLGFWNNVLGMAGLVRDRRAAKKNRNERKEYEDLVALKTAEKKRARAMAEQQQAGGAGDGSNNNNGKLSP